ncbi:MAG: response regulator [Eubacterium sp.]|nr:response regulator [Eubacterium sp.]MBR7072388.1 response regulator [Eubacterium sp.]
MKIICVDDEVIVLNHTVTLCKALDGEPEVYGFSTAKAALSHIEENGVDIAILDIDMPDMNGLVLATKVKSACPDSAIIFLTGHSQYATDAFKMHVSGYLMKPVSREDIQNEINYAVSHKPGVVQSSHIFARTFGEFDLLLDGEPIVFSRSKSKELLAYLIDRNGASVSRKSAFAAIYEDKPYDRPMQKQFDVIIRSLKETLKEYEISDILKIQSGEMRVVNEKIDCDLYRLLKGDTEAVNAFRGEYMSSYSWAMLTEAYIYEKLNQ